MFAVERLQKLPLDWDYFNLNNRLTKSELGLLTIPFLRRLRFRFFDFLVKMCRLYARWKEILPVPVTLNLFLALELVFTLGILYRI